MSPGLNRKRQTRSSACEHEIGHHDAAGVDEHAALGEADGEEAPQRLMAERFVILAPPPGILARRESQRALDAEIEHPGIGQPPRARTEEIGRADHGVPVDPGWVDRGLGRRAGRRQGQGPRRASDEEARAAARDHRALGREPVVGFDDGRFRHVELGGELAHRGEPGAARERPGSDAVANEGRGHFDSGLRPVIHVGEFQLYSQWFGTLWSNCTELSLAAQARVRDSHP